MRTRALTVGLIGVLAVTGCGHHSEEGRGTTPDTRATDAAAVPAREPEAEPGEEMMPHTVEPVAEASRILPRTRADRAPGTTWAADEGVVNDTDACPRTARVASA